MLDRHIRHVPNRRGFPAPPPATRLYRNIAVTFLVFTAVIVGIAVWMSMARADVRVRVKHDTAEIETTVEVAKQPEQGQLSGRVVTGVFDRIQEFDVDETVTSEIVATTTGRVRVTNRYSKDQPLIKTTRILTPDGKLFRINRTVDVPRGGSVDVEAYSDKPGNDYLIAKGTTFTIPGLWIDLQKLITAEALTDFEGGTTAVAVVSQTHIDNAITELEADVLGTAKRTLAAEAGIPEGQFDEDCQDPAQCWMGIYVIDRIEEKTNVQAGQQTDAFLAQIKLKVTAVFYKKQDMDAFVRMKLKESVAEGREIVDFTSEPIVFTLRDADASLETAGINVSARASTRLTERNPLLSKESIAGKPVEEAKESLLGVQGVEFVEIKLRPSWARKLPMQTGRIQIIIE